MVYWFVIEGYHIGCLHRVSHTGDTTAGRQGHAVEQLGRTPDIFGYHMVYQIYHTSQPWLICQTKQSSWWFFMFFHHLIGRGFGCIPNPRWNGLLRWCERGRLASVHGVGRIKDHLSTSVPWLFRRKGKFQAWNGRMPSFCWKHPSFRADCPSLPYFDPERC